MKKAFKTIDIVYMGVSVALIAICSWITIPLPSGIPVTLQTMGICLICAILGTKRGVVAVISYLLIGFAGVPVFSGFTAGVAKLISPTGGYMVGFVFTAIIIGLVTEAVDKRNFKKPLKYTLYITAMIVGIAVLYTFGTVWFIYIYSRNQEKTALSTVLGLCVLPYIIPDLVKLVIATFISIPLKKKLSKIK